MLLSRKIVLRKWPGFTLVEISLVLLIAGIIIGSVMKAKDLVDVAYAKSAASDFTDLQIAAAEYVSCYGSLPGDDKAAAARFPGTENGDGDGKISADDAKKVFPHLFASGRIIDKDYRKPRIGGRFFIASVDGSAWIKLSSPDDDGVLTAKQAILIKSKLMENCGIPEWKIAIEPKEISMEKNECKYSVLVKLY
jgi:prepilin-type N-terminal cleavage/methylation domain-containing protein